MTAHLPRRDAFAAVLAAMAMPAAPAIARGRHHVPTHRGDDTPRLPDHAAFWARMPLPFTPAEAWHLLSSATQEEWRPHYEAAKVLMDRLEATEPKTMLGMALACLGPIGAAGYNAPADWDEVRGNAWDRAGAEFADAVIAGTLASLPISEPGPVDLLAAAGLDLSRLSLRDVAALTDIAATLTRMVRAMQCQPRSTNDTGLNDVGRFTDWLGDQLDAQIDATISELRAREPADWIERDIRLGTIAEATVSNGDPAQTVSFARELLASVKQ